jgi:hypothetical protein
MTAVELMPTSASSMTDHPLFSLVALWVLLANTVDSLVFIPATVYFFYHISGSLDVKGMKMISTIMSNHSGVDYMVLIALKLYILIGGIPVIVTGSMNNFTHPIQFVVGWSHTVAICMLLSSSFSTTKELMETKVKVINNQSCIEPGLSFLSTVSSPPQPSQIMTTKSISLDL